MSDGISINVDSEAFTKAMDDHIAKAPRAAMYAMRQAARVARIAGRAKAPVYKGPARVGVVKGELRASIKPSRNITQAGDVFSMVIGPIGNVKRAKGKRRTSEGGGQYGVPYYRAKQEARFGFMAAARDAADAGAAIAFTEAFEKQLNS